MKYTHLFVTKVNIKWLPQSKDEVWLKNRINLLNNIVRPSLEAQTNKNFKFVTLWGYEPIGKLDNEYQIIVNTENDSNLIHQEFLPKLIELIDEDYVLTTRIDTDNAISNNFVEILHNHITETEIPFYYDISHMDMLDLRTRKKMVWPAKGTSAFVSVMENKYKYKCIPYSSGHGTVGKIMKGIKFDDLNALCTIHNENIYMKKALGSPTDFDEKNKYSLGI